MCATFAETELISLLAQGSRREDIAASVHRAVATRTLGLVAQVGRRTPVVMTGGVAHNARRRALPGRGAACRGHRAVVAADHRRVRRSAAGPRRRRVGRRRRGRDQGDAREPARSCSTCEVATTYLGTPVP